MDQATISPAVEYALVPPSDSDPESDRIDHLDTRLDQFAATVRFLCGSQEFHTDPYSAARTVIVTALQAAVNSPNIGLGREQDEYRGLLMHFTDID